MTQAPVRIGIVGLGGVAQVHLDACRNSDSVRLVAVCDVREDVVKRVAAETGAAGFTDHRALLGAGGVDLLLILAPARFHRPIAEDAAAAGVHVLSEKPLAVSVEDAEAMVTACRRADVKLFYGSCYRYLPAIVTARELIAQGVVGEVRLMLEEINGGGGLEAWTELGPDHYPPGGPGGHGMGLVDHGVHLIDILPWLVDSPIVSASGRGQISGAAPVNEFMHMQLANGADAFLQYNLATFATDLPNEGQFSEGSGWGADGAPIAAGRWDSHPPSIRVHGTRGSLRIHYYGNQLYLFDTQGVRQVPVQGRAAPGHFATQIEGCARAIREDLEPSIPGEAGVAALTALRKVYGQSPFTTSRAIERQELQHGR